MRRKITSLGNANYKPGESKSSLDDVIRSPGFMFTVAIMYLFFSPLTTSAIRAVLEIWPKIKDISRNVYSNTYNNIINDNFGSGENWLGRWKHLLGKCISNLLANELKKKLFFWPRHTHIWNFFKSVSANITQLGLITQKSTVKIDWYFRQLIRCNFILWLRLIDFEIIDSSQH